MVQIWHWASQHLTEWQTQQRGQSEKPKLTETLLLSKDIPTLVTKELLLEVMYGTSPQGEKNVTRLLSIISNYKTE